MNILVTGGAGFIGSNLCEYLLEQGHTVTCLDNFSTGKFENIRELHHRYAGHFRMQVGDIRNPGDCRKALEGDIETVFHQAALGSVPRSIQDPLTTNDVNVGGFLNLLAASRDARVRRFIFAASSSTYGDSSELPKREEVIGHPLSPYAVTKLVDELYAEVFHRIYGLQYIGLRYFNVFGRRQSPDGAYAAVIPRFVQQLLRHESPRINGDGTYSRDFTYIGNVIRMNQLALDAAGPDALNTIYNTACGEQTTLNQLFTTLRESLASYDPAIAAVQPRYGAPRPGDIPHSLASIDKARRLLGYEPPFTVSEGLKEAVKWYYKNLK